MKPFKGSFPVKMHSPRLPLLAATALEKSFLYSMAFTFSQRSVMANLIPISELEHKLLAYKAMARAQAYQKVATVLYKMTTPFF